MLSENELWIGDKVRLKKSGRIGKYEGRTNSGKHRVRIGYKIVNTTLSNLEIIDTPEAMTPPPKKAKKVRLEYEPLFTERVLDLHIEKLKPSMLNANPIRIRDYQIATAQSYIEHSYLNSWKSIVIIHGNGNGVLRSEVHHMAKISPYVTFFFPINNNGATELVLKS